MVIKLCLKSSIGFRTVHAGLSLCDTTWPYFECGVFHTSDAAIQSVEYFTGFVVWFHRVHISCS